MGRGQQGQGGQQERQPQGLLEEMDSRIKDKIKESISSIKEKVTHEGAYDPRMEEFLSLPFGIGGLYISEDKPVEYGDCLRWPESCDNAGFKKFFTNLKLGFGIPKVSFSECEMIIIIPMGIGPITFPHLTLSYRKPNCEEPEPPQPEPEPNDPSPPPIIKEFLVANGPATIQLTFTTQVTIAPWILGLTSYSISNTWVARVNISTPIFLRTTTTTLKGSGIYPELPSLSREEILLMARQGGFGGGPFLDPHNSTLTTFTFFRKDNPYEETQLRFFLQAPGVTQPSSYPRVGESVHYYPFIANWDDPGYIGQVWKTVSTTLDIQINDEPPTLVKIPIPPFPHPQIEEPMDNCCRKTLKLLKQLHKNAAIDRRPFTLPRNMIQPGAKPDKKVELYDQADDYEFLIRFLDRSIGALPIETQVEDADPNTPGDQNMLMRHESVGAALSSLIQIAFSGENAPAAAQNSAANSSKTATNELVVNLLIRAMYAIGGIYKVVAQNALELQEMSEFMGFKSNEKTEKLKLPFNPIAKILQDIDKENPNALSEKQLDAFLETTSIQVQFSENEDKETMVSLYYKCLTELSAIRASVVTRVKDKNEFNKALDAALLTTQISQLVLLRDIKKALGTMKEAEFERWFAELEKRYTEGMSPVATDNDEEFQAPLQNSPRFRVVEKPQTDG